MGTVRFPPHLRSVFSNVKLNIPGYPRNVQLGNAIRTTTTTTAAATTTSTSATTTTTTAVETTATTTTQQQQEQQEQEQQQQQQQQQQDNWFWFPQRTMNSTSSFQFFSGVRTTLYKMSSVN